MNQNLYKKKSTKVKNEIKFRSLALLGLGLILCTSARSASFDLGGDYRFGSNMFNRLNTGLGGDPGAAGTTAFLENRFLLRPDVVVDERFTVKSELSVLQVGPGASDRVGDAFGAPLGSESTPKNEYQSLYVRRAYLEWANDYGILRVGRQPKSWGLGILYDAGNDSWDDFGTTIDRVGFQGLVGSLNINLGYEKEAEGAMAEQNDDVQNYEVSVDFSNPEDLFNIGLLYNRHIKAAQSANVTLNSAHIISIYLQKKFESWQTGFEFASLQLSDQSSVFGFLSQTDYKSQPKGGFKFGFDVAVSGGTDSVSYRFHPNYKPFLILFNQTVGTGQSASDIRGGADGSPVGDSTMAGGGRGAYLFKTRFAHGFENDEYILGADLGYAQLMRQGTNQGKSLGYEVDANLSQKIYDNFSMKYETGMLFPGRAFHDAAHKSRMAWGVRIRGSLEF